jgi:membrane-bound serine protease (ClpP class)
VIHSGQDELSCLPVEGVLLVSLIGAALILLALVLFAVDLKVIGHGLPAFGGLVVLVLGILVLFDVASYTLVALVIVVALVVLVGVLFVAGPGELLTGSGRQAATGVEGMVGEVGVVREPIGAGSPGWVFVHGELWRAEVAVAPEDSYEGDHEQTIGVGRKVRVVEIKDGKVVVLPLESNVSRISLEG